MWKLGHLFHPISTVKHSSILGARGFAGVKLETQYDVPICVEVCRTRDATVPEQPSPLKTQLVKSSN
jgi:hypothetical protein